MATSGPAVRPAVYSDRAIYILLWQQVCRDRYPIKWVEPSAWDKCPIAASHIGLPTCLLPKMGAGRRRLRSAQANPVLIYADTDCREIARRAVQAESTRKPGGTDWRRYFSFGVACSFMMDIVARVQSEFQFDSNVLLFCKLQVDKITLIQSRQSSDAADLPLRISSRMD